MEVLKTAWQEATLNKVIRQELCGEVTSERRPEDRSHFRAKGRGNARLESHKNKLRLFEQQTEGPVWLGWRELKGVVGREIKQGP